MTHPEQHPPAGSESKEQDERALRERMSQIRRRLVVVSGKGGVGKSTVAANLAVALWAQGRAVGLLDVDIHGPSIPTILGCEGATLLSDGTSILPLSVREQLKIMSISFLLGSRSEAVIWRGPLKFKVIRQFLCDVAWGELDYLIVDCPPGTGDEPLSVAQLIGRPAAAVVVTTPQRLAVTDVRRCITFCQKAELSVAGVLENMSGYVCPKCGFHVDLFGAGGGERLSEEMDVPFLGRIPIDPQIVGCGDEGISFLEAHPDSPASQCYSQLADRLHHDESLWRSFSEAAQ